MFSILFFFLYLRTDFLFALQLTRRTDSWNINTRHVLLLRFDLKILFDVFVWRKTQSRVWHLHPFHGSIGFDEHSTHHFVCFLARLLDIHCRTIGFYQPTMSHSVRVSIFVCVFSFFSRTRLTFRFRFALRRALRPPPPDNLENFACLVALREFCDLNCTVLSPRFPIVIQLFNSIASLLRRRENYPTQIRIYERNYKINYVKRSDVTIRKPIINCENYR